MEILQNFESLLVETPFFAVLVLKSSINCRKHKTFSMQLQLLLQIHIPLTIIHEADIYILYLHDTEQFITY